MQPLCECECVCYLESLILVTASAIPLVQGHSKVQDEHVIGVEAGLSQWHLKANFNIECCSNKQDDIYVIASKEATQSLFCSL